MSLGWGFGEKPASTISWGFGLTPAQRWTIRAIETLPPEVKKKVKRKLKYKWLVKPKRRDVIGIGF